MAIPFQISNPSGDLIRGNLHLPESSNGRKHPVVVICHGFTGFKDWGFYPFLANSLAKAGIAAVRFNFSHNGIEEDDDVFTRLDLFAKDTTGKQNEDLRAVLDAIGKRNLPHAEHLDPGRIGLYGHSRGTVPVLLEGGKAPNVKALVTWGGIATCMRFSEEERHSWRREGWLPIPNERSGQQMIIDVMVLDEYEAHADEYDLLAAARRLQTPYLVVHGDEDEAVPLDEAMALHDNTPRGFRRLQIIPGGNHNFGAVHPLRRTNEVLNEATRVTLDWYKARL